jgi:hypothetical protein
LDTAIIVSVIIGSVVAIVLVFAKTVLGVAWTGKSTRSVRTTETRIQDKLRQEYPLGISNSKSELRLIQKLNQSSVDVQKTATLNSLINKQVSTCDHATIGNIHSVSNGMMVVTHNESSSQQKRYEIPIYFVRQNYEYQVLLDICARDLEHYVPQMAY